MNKENVTWHIYFYGDWIIVLTLGFFATKLVFCWACVRWVPGTHLQNASASHLGVRQWHCFELYWFCFTSEKGCVYPKSKAYNMNQRQFSSSSFFSNNLFAEPDRRFRGVPHNWRSREVFSVRAQVEIPIADVIVIFEPTVVITKFFLSQFYVWSLIW